MNDNDKVTCEDMDNFAKEYALREQRAKKNETFERHILENMRSDLGSMCYMLEQFKSFETKFLCDAVTKCIDEIERIQRDGSRKII